MDRRPVIGVMGGGTADDPTLETAEALGRAIAEEGWILLNGGRDAGVMAASASGARSGGGFVVGVLPGRGSNPGGVSPDLDLALFTGMGDGRNVINVLSSDVVVALPGGPGTLSEVALALKSDREVILLGWGPTPLPATLPSERIHRVEDAHQALETIRRLLDR